MSPRHIRISAVLVTLYAAPSTTDTANRPLALLITAGSRATITQGGAREKPLPAAPGDLIRAGARLITGGERVRFLYFPDGYTYEFTPSFPSYPAPSYQAIDQPNTQFEIRLVTPKPVPQKGKLTAGERFAIQIAGLDVAGADPAGAGGAIELAALKKIESEMEKPANRQDPLWQLARAIALERTNQANRAIPVYQALSKQWTQAVWLRKKIPALQAAATAADERRELLSRPPRTYAVIVGISDYQRFSRVDYADNDAVLFQSHLRSPRGGSAPENQIFTLTNKQATKAAVSNLLEQVFAKLAGPQDTVYLFFSGQGLSETAEEAERGYLLQFDSDPQEKYSSAYSIDELRRLIRTRSRGVARVLMFADLCRTAAYQRSPNRINTVAKTQLSDIHPQAGAILSSRAEQVSEVASDPQGGHGVFTFYLVKGLQGEADTNGDGLVSFNELFAYVEDRVRKTTADRQQPIDAGAIPANVQLSDLRLPPMPASYRRLGELAALWPAQGLLFFLQAPQAQASSRSVELENEGQQILLEYLRGDERSQSKDAFERGRDLLAEANRLAPSAALEAKRLFFEGRGLAFDKNTDPAIPLLEEAVRLDPAAGYAYNGLGIAYLKKGLLPQAAWSFRDAKRLAPHWIYPRHNLALTYMESGAYTPAEKEYREAIRLEGQTASLHYGLGLLLHRTNRNKEAGREYREALRINPNLAEAHTGLGIVLAGERKTARAEREYKQALELKPDLSAARHDLARLYAKSGNDTEAIRLWEENIRRDPEFLESRLSLAAAHARAGRFDAAIAQYEAILAGHADYTAARRALYEAEGDRSLAAGEKQAAADRYRKALEVAADDEDRGRLKKKVKRSQK